MRAAISIFALLLLPAVSSCSSSSTYKGGDAAITTDVAQSSDVAQTKDLASDIRVDAPVVPPANVMFPDAPEVSCGGDAGDCQFPPSACADPSCDGGACPGFQWVVYYDNPMCVSGKCVYTNRYFECSLGTMCSAGGCRFNGTTAAP
jgi:hypothetical protein